MCGRAGRPPFDDTGMVIIMTRRETVTLSLSLSPPMCVCVCLSRFLPPPVTYAPAQQIFINAHLLFLYIFDSLIVELVLIEIVLWGIKFLNFNF